MSLFEMLGIDNQEMPKKNGGKKSNFVSKKTKESSVQEDLFNKTFEKIKEDKKELEMFNNMKNTLNTIKVEKTTVNMAIKEELNFLMSRENLNTNKEKRYQDNIDAIKTLNKIKNERLATEKEQKILSKYVGWGGLSEKFNNDIEDAKLKTILKDNYDSAKSTVLTSFYTPSIIIKFMYRVLNRIGFERGRILEPSCGTGRFLGFMPEDMFNASKITCVEIDKVSANITKNLYQSVNVINSPFEDVELKDDSFDLIISNIPFSQQIPYGKTDKELNDYKFHIHDYFFVKALKKLKPGGIMAFLTSSGTMDKKDDELRKLLSQKCELIGAVRLPQGAFSDTQVTTDIIFLQKLNGTISTNEWVKLKEKDGITINEYFIDNPDMMLGDMKIVSGQFGPTQALISKTKFTNDTIKNMHTKFTNKELYVTPPTDDYMYEKEELKELQYNDDLVDGELTIRDNKIFQRQGNSLIPFRTTKKSMILDYINLKECIKNIIKIQVNNCKDEELKMKQIELNSLYNKFKIKYDEISTNKNKRVLNADTRYPLVSSLEIYNPQTDKYEKAQIFTTRTIGKITTIEDPKTIEDAIMLSENDLGYLDIEYVARRLKRPAISVIVEALEKKIIYAYAESDECIKDQSKIIYQSAGEFISGYVKDKLRMVEMILNKLNNIDSRELTKYHKFLMKYLGRSKGILEANQPERVTEVYFEIQSSWIPLEIKEKFLNKILKTKNTRLLFNENLGYVVEIKDYVSGYISKTEWGTDRVEAKKIIKAALNMTDIEVTDRVRYGSDKKDVKNVKETQLANDKKEELKLAFNEFINNDINLLNDVLDIYNDLFINYVDRKYTNILHNLQINPEVKPRQHQLVGASRIITSQYNTLLFHSVGSGKTYTMILASQELKRISKFGNKVGCKNLFIIPNHLCQSGQFAKDYLTIYPQANILATTSKDFTKANRRKLLSKIMTSNWDAILIPYSQLGSIELKPDTETKLAYQDLEDIENAINYLNDNSSKYSIKRLEKMRIQILDRLKALNDMHRDNCGIYWEDLGITNIFLDEAHNYKNLFFKTKLSVPGIGGTTAKKTTDLYNKIRYQRSLYGEKGIVFATATPISNSMSEIYIMMKYLSEGVLHRYGFSCFDQWASTFGKVVTNMEINPTGKGFRFKSSFSKFNNVPELMQLFRHCADIVNIKDIEDIKLPSLKDGKPTDIQITPTPEMLAYIENLVERSKDIAEGRIDPCEDNMLMVANDGRKLAVCPYLVGVNGDSPKINKVSEILSGLYKKYPDKTHMVFCDLGTPKKNSRKAIKKESLIVEVETENDEEEQEIDLNELLEQYSFNSSHNVYQELKDKLIDKGVKEDDIIFIHDYESADKRKAILDEFKAGNKKILIGSSQKLSEGVNVQDKLKSLHHICVPWKPATIEQREGRIVRQGNENEEVEIYRYIVNNSFDAYSWQILERKANYIAQVLSGASTSRVIEDIEMQLMTYSSAKACACGDPRIMQLHNLKNDLQKLQTLEKAFKDKKLSLLNDIKSHERYIEFNKDKAHRLGLDLNIVKQNETEDEHSIILGGMQYNSETIDEAVETLKLLLNSTQVGTIGYIYNLPIKLQLRSKFDKLEKYITIGENYQFDIVFKSYAKIMYNDIIDYKRTIELSINQSEKSINIHKKEIEEINTGLDKPFIKAQELRELKLKVSSLEKELSLEESVA